VTDTDCLVYVYGVLDASDTTPIDAEGVGGESHPVRRIVHGDVAALVSDVPSGPLAAARDLRAHWRVLEAASRATTVLPVKFGTAMEDDDAVRDEFLAPGAHDLADRLRALNGKVQLTVKAFYDEEVLLRDVVKRSPEVARIRSRLKQLPAAATYYERIRLGELVAAEVDRRRAHHTDLVLHRLEPLAAAARAEPPTTEDGAVNVAFLVDRTRVDEFGGEVEQLAAELEDGLRVRFLGPLPPYSFASGGAVVGEEQRWD
jgi:hypothetical protein